MQQDVAGRRRNYPFQGEPEARVTSYKRFRTWLIRKRSRESPAASTPLATGQRCRPTFKLDGVCQRLELDSPSRHQETAQRAQESRLIVCDTNATPKTQCIIANRRRCSDMFNVPKQEWIWTAHESGDAQSTGGWLASGSADGLLHIWDHDVTGSRRPLTTMKQPSAVKAMGWCPWKRNVMATGGGWEDGKLRIWDTELARCVGSADTNSQICSLNWVEATRILVTGHGRPHNSAICWDWNFPSLRPLLHLSGKRTIHSAVYFPWGSIEPLFTPNNTQKVYMIQGRCMNPWSLD
ncbi:uncharacterized protein LOC109525834 [Hippocampus comes]|uniref:uncharacterized protein LOC109525834 n=1 Tax=Hippocampus comes TaxID=109280 RepID=UPI00094E5397|nr:PREDICTED: uncharacterized protein LOC109525834 [Hippocampus comes]